MAIRPKLTPPSEGPKKPSDWDLMKWGKEHAEAALKCNDVEKCQEYIRVLDSVQKDNANTQAYLGSQRRIISSHCQALRQASPKGRPEEGTVVKRGDRSLIFLDGSWQPYKGEPSV